MVLGMVVEAAREVQLSADGRTLAVHVPIAFRKRGGRKVVIAPVGGSPSVPGQASSPRMPHAPKPQRSVDQSLLKVLAQAHHFQRLLDEGRYATVGDLARAMKLDPSFVARILRATLLAPDIVEAILDGTQPPTMHRQMLLRGLPLEWKEQRERVQG